MKTIKFTYQDGEQFQTKSVVISAIISITEYSYDVEDQPALYIQDTASIVIHGKNGPEYKYKKIKDATFKKIYNTTIALTGGSYTYSNLSLSEIEELIKNA